LDTGTITLDSFIKKPKERTVKWFYIHTDIAPYCKWLSVNTPATFPANPSLKVTHPLLLEYYIIIFIKLNEAGKRVNIFSFGQKLVEIIFLTKERITHWVLWVGEATPEDVTVNLKMPLCTPRNHVGREWRDNSTS
jgi:hypothetical protein